MNAPAENAGVTKKGLKRQRSTKHTPDSNDVPHATHTRCRVYI